MSDLYSELYASKGKAYFDYQVKDESLLKVYPDIDNTKSIRGNSRISGDIDTLSQHKVIDILITIGARYKLTYKEISYVLLCAHVESGYNPDAAAGTTTAAGIGQATVAFVKYTLRNSSKWLGFTLDITGEKIFDAELGCYALVFSFLRARDLVSDFYKPNDNDYWRWLYYLHHDGMAALRQYHKNEHTLSADAIECANDIVAKLPVIENLLKTTQVAISFKLSAGDDTPVANKEYVATVSLSYDKSCPNIVSLMNDPLLFIKGKTDAEGKTEAINALAGAEIVFTILKDNYKKLAMSGSVDSSDKPEKEKKDKQKEKHSDLGLKSGTTFTVKSGDTLSAIAKSQGTTVENLKKLNNLPNVNILHIGQVLKLSEPNNNETESKSSIDYISRYIPREVKQALMKYLGVDDGNYKAAISYSRSHIVLPSGSISADVDKNKNVVHVKTTTKSTTIKKKQTPVEKHKTDDKGTAKPTIVQNDFEPTLVFVKGRADESRVSDKSKNILKILAKEAGVHVLYITSTLRTPEEQAQAMYTNIRNKGIESQHYYARNGRMVVDAGVAAGIENKGAALGAMINKIKELQGKNEIVSRHCVSPDMYLKKNVIDISKTRLGSLGRALDRVIKRHMKSTKGLKYISPYSHAGEPAIHLEIDQ